MSLWRPEHRQHLLIREPTNLQWRNAKSNKVDCLRKTFHKLLEEHYCKMFFFLKLTTIQWGKKSEVKQESNNKWKDMNSLVSRLESTSHWRRNEMIELGWSSSTQIVTVIYFVLFLKTNFLVMKWRMLITFSQQYSSWLFEKCTNYITN